MKDITIKIDETNELSSNKISQSALGEEKIYSGIINILLSCPVSVLSDISKLCIEKQIEIERLKKNLNAIDDKSSLSMILYDEMEAYRILSVRLSYLYEALSKK